MVHKRNTGDTPGMTCENEEYAHIHRTYYLYY